TLHLFIVLLDLGTLFIVAHDPWCVQFESGRDQDDMIRTLFLLMPKANHPGMQRHLTLGPHMLYAAPQGNRLCGPGAMRLPLVGHLGQLHGLLRRQHIGLGREYGLELAWAVAPG